MLHFIVVTMFLMSMVHFIKFASLFSFKFIYIYDLVPSIHCLYIRNDISTNAQTLKHNINNVCNLIKLKQAI